ncbi:hypothetical protein F3Y22_tig00117032pilonHSYRG00064 [Hibiscus syriacus]|uniref:Uncharacterized protein n=1 Tax=Hibiscus syriacus TaxID=106335 RepID=A0A6A2WBD8_HIBSY|nr:hypothetical protein F3Y22_tig00117032pilonHSYRG00064 [Hibiscus syriacus]
MAHLKEMMRFSFFKFQLVCVEDDRVSSECSTGAMASASPNAKVAAVDGEGEDDDLDDTATSSQVCEGKIVDQSSDLSKDSKEAGTSASEPPTWVEWRETPGSDETSDIVRNCEVQMKLVDKNPDDTTDPSSSSSVNTSETALETSHYQRKPLLNP